MQIRILFLLSLCCFSVESLKPRASPSISAPASAITTLPPAHPDTPDRDPCSFVDRDELLKRVVDEWKGYNVSLLVETCPDVCVLIYGSGNPDVSGIGVWVCYIVQFISTLILGPILFSLTVLENHLSARFNRIRLMVREDIVPVITSGSTWITLSIMIASLARLAQRPPIFEVDFIHVLLWLQVLMAAGRGLWGVASLCWAEPDLKDPENRHLPSLVACLFVTPAFCAALVVTGKGSSDWASYEALVAMSHFCWHEMDLPIPAPPPKQPKDDSFDFPWWASILTMIAMMVVVALSVLIWIGLESLVDNLWEKLSWSRQQQLLKIYNRTRSFVIVSLWLIPGILWLMLGIWALVTLQQYRNALQMALGKQYQDSFWGFGQVAIVVMLLPTISEVVKPLIVRRLWNRDEKLKAHQLEPLVGRPGDADDGVGSAREALPPSVRLGNGDQDEEVSWSRSTN